MKRICWTSICLLVAVNLLAKTYWRESVDTISTPGYYNIELSQEMAGVGLHTLRIWDDTGNEVPYLLRSSMPVKEMKQLEMYNLVSNVARDSVNTIIVENQGEEVSRFYLQIKKADVDKYISIRGSYNKKEWFSVKQRTPLRSEQNPSLDEIAIVDFPQGSYTYYELTVTNNSRSPLNITGVGKIEKSTIYGQFVELTPGVFTVEEDKSGNTVIAFPEMPYPYYLSKLEMKVTGKGHYSRNVRLKRDSLHTAGSFTLSSRDEAAFYFDNQLIEKNFRLVIENQHNPPLIVNNIKLYGLNRYLCAYLDVGVHYRIETTTEAHHHYDIQDFADEISFNLPIVKTSKIEEIVVAPEPERELSFYEKPLFLWGAIALTGIILLLICIRTVRKLKIES